MYYFFCHVCSRDKKKKTKIKTGRLKQATDKRVSQVYTHSKLLGVDIESYIAHANQWRLKIETLTTATKREKATIE